MLFADTRLPQRFWDKVEIDDAGCWLWTAALNRDGYGMFGWTGTMKLAHRVAYAELVGDIGVGLMVDHLCRVRDCVNPQHLEPVTPRENIMRSPLTTSAINARKTHCSTGDHEFNEVNTIWDTTLTKRACRVCRNIWQNANAQAKRDEIKRARAAA